MPYVTRDESLVRGPGAMVQVLLTQTVTGASPPMLVSTGRLHFSSLLHWERESRASDRWEILIQVLIVRAPEAPIYVCPT